MRSPVSLLLVLAGSWPAPAQKPVVFPGGVVNSATYAKAGQPGHPVVYNSLVSIFGTNLASTTAWASGFPLPKSLGGTSVTFRGVPAPLVYVSPGQINAQYPPTDELNQNPFTVVVTTAAGASDPVPFEAASSGVGLFTLDGSGCGRAAAFNVTPDGRLTLNGLDNSVEPNGVIAVFGTGMPVYALRPPAPPAGEPAPFNPPSTWDGGGVVALVGGNTFPDKIEDTPKILFAGLTPGMAGLAQFNIALPASAQQGCAVSLQVTADVSTSQAVPISVHRGGGRCVDPPIASIGVLRWKKTVFSSATPKPSEEQLVVDFSAAPGKLLPPAPPTPPIPWPPNPWAAPNYRLVILPPVGPACPRFDGNRLLDAGILTARAPVTSPFQSGGTFQFAPRIVNGSPVYEAPLPAGTIRAGTFTVTAAGGADVGPFTTSVTAPPSIELTTTFPPGTVVSDSQPLTVTWKGGTPDSVFRLRATSRERVNWGSRLESIVKASVGQVTLYASPMYLLGLQGDLEIVITLEGAQAQAFQAPGLTLGGQHGWIYEWRFTDISAH